MSAPKRVDVKASPPSPEQEGNSAAPSDAGVSRPVAGGRLLSKTSMSGSITNLIQEARPRMFKEHFPFIEEVIELAMGLTERRVKGRERRAVITSAEIWEVVPRLKGAALSEHTKILIDAGLFERVGRGEFKLSATARSAYQAELDDRMRGLTPGFLHGMFWHASKRTPLV